MIISVFCDRGNQGHLSGKNKLHGIIPTSNETDDALFRLTLSFVI